MRYAQGGGLTAEGRRRREQVRLEAARRFEQRVPSAGIAAELRVSERAVRRWRPGGRAGGGGGGGGRDGRGAGARRGCARRGGGSAGGGGDGGGRPGWSAVRPGWPRAGRRPSA